MDSLGSLSASDIASIYEAANRSTGSLCEQLPRPDGLRPEVELMPHQCAAAQWMLAREAAQDALHEGIDHRGATEEVAEDIGTRNSMGNTSRGKRKQAAASTVTSAAASAARTKVNEPTSLDPVGGVLADEPGLGKTLSVLTLLLSGRSKAQKKPSLIVSPTPAIAAQWHSEVVRFCLPASIDAVVYGGPPSNLTGDALEEAVQSLLERLLKADLVLTDLAVVRRELHHFRAQSAGRSKRCHHVSPLFAVGTWRRVIVDEVQEVESQASAAATMLRVLRTHHRWGVSGTVITNGLVALKSLAEFLGLQPYADPSWWKEHIGSSTATAAANRGNKFGGSWTSFKKRGSSSTQEEEEEAAAAEAAAAKAVAVAQHARLGRLQDLARQHMWRTRQGDTKPMPPQKFLPPCRVRASQLEHAVLYPLLDAFSRKAVFELPYGWENDPTPLSPADLKSVLANGGGFVQMSRGAVHAALAQGNTATKGSSSSSSNKAVKHEGFRQLLWSLPQQMSKVRNDAEKIASQLLSQRLSSAPTRTPRDFPLDGRASAAASERTYPLDVSSLGALVACQGAMATLRRKGFTVPDSTQLEVAWHLRKLSRLRPNLVRAISTHEEQQQLQRKDSSSPSSSQAALRASTSGFIDSRGKHCNNSSSIDDDPLQAAALARRVLTQWQQRRNPNIVQLLLIARFGVRSSSAPSGASGLPQRRGLPVIGVRAWRLINAYCGSSEDHLCSALADKLYLQRPADVAAASVAIANSATSRIEDGLAKFTEEEGCSIGGKFGDRLLKNSKKGGVVAMEVTNQDQDNNDDDDDDEEEDDEGYVHISGEVLQRPHDGRAARAHASEAFGGGSQVPPLVGLEGFSSAATPATAAEYDGSHYFPGVGGMAIGGTFHPPPEQPALRVQLLLERLQQEDASGCGALVARAFETLPAQLVALIAFADDESPSSSSSSKRRLQGGGPSSQPKLQRLRTRTKEMLGQAADPSASAKRHRGYFDKAFCTALHSFYQGNKAGTAATKSSEGTTASSRREHHASVAGAALVDFASSMVSARAACLAQFKWIARAQAHGCLADPDSLHLRAHLVCENCDSAVCENRLDLDRDERRDRRQGTGGIYPNASSAAAAAANATSAAGAHTVGTASSSSSSSSLFDSALSRSPFPKSARVLDYIPPTTSTLYDDDPSVGACLVCRARRAAFVYQAHFETTEGRATLLMRCFEALDQYTALLNPSSMPSSSSLSVSSLSSSSSTSSSSSSSSSSFSSSIVPSTNSASTLVKLFQTEAYACLRAARDMEALAEAAKRLRNLVYESPSSSNMGSSRKRFRYGAAFRYSPTKWRATTACFALSPHNYSPARYEGVKYRDNVTDEAAATKQQLASSIDNAATTSDVASHAQKEAASFAAIHAEGSSSTVPGLPPDRPRNAVLAAQDAALELQLIRVPSAARGGVSRSAEERFHWTLDFWQYLDAAASVMANCSSVNGGKFTSCGMCGHGIQRARNARVLMCAHVLCASCAEMAVNDQRRAVPSADALVTSSPSSELVLSSSSSPSTTAAAAAASTSSSSSIGPSSKPGVDHAAAGRICPLCSFAQPFLLSDAPLVSTGSSLAERNPQNDDTAQEATDHEDDLLQHALNLSAAGEASMNDAVDKFSDWTCVECTCENAATADCCEACSTPRSDFNTAAAEAAPSSLHFDFTSRGLAVGTQVAKLVAGYGPLRGVVVECRLDPKSGNPSCVIEDRCKAWLQPLDDHEDDDNDEGIDDEKNGEGEVEIKEKDDSSGGKNSEESGDDDCCSNHTTKRQRTSKASNSSSSSDISGAADTTAGRKRKGQGKSERSSEIEEAVDAIGAPEQAGKQPWRNVREVFDLDAIVQEAELAKVLGPCNATSFHIRGALSTNGQKSSEEDNKYNSTLAVDHNSSHQRHRCSRNGNGLVSGFGSKVDAVVAELRALKRKAPGTKSLVFSQWADALTLLRHALTANSVTSLLLTGDSKAVDTLHKFRATTDSTGSDSSSSTAKKSKSKSSGKDSGSNEHWNGPIDVLLMPLKATNAGLSLNEATHVFLLDTTLNRGLETQALARVRRINSTQPTIVHRFVMRGTIEEAIWDLLKQSQEKKLHSEDGGQEIDPRSASSRSNNGTSALTSSPPSSTTAAATTMPHEVRRCDVHRLLTSLRDLYCTDPAAVVAEKDGGVKATHRPAWRARFLRDLKDLSK